MVIATDNKVNPDVYKGTLQKCLEVSNFPECWKKQKLVLLPKLRNPPGDLLSFRPICMLNTLGILLEIVSLNRLIEVTESENELSNKQFGFRKGRITIDVMLDSAL